MIKFNDVYPNSDVKIFPENIAGTLGLPSVGNIFYVDPGKSVSGGGKTQEDAFKTLAEAYAVMSADNDDVVIIAPSSSTGRTSETASITWAKRRTHIVGNGPLRNGWNRAGISFSSAVTTPSMTISANNCSFSNFMIYNDNDVNVLVNSTGDYNTFNYVHFAGIANATTGDDTAARCLVLSASHDNKFNNCQFGIDTVLRSAANATLEFASGSARNEFRGCKFVAQCDNAGVFHVLANDAATIDRYVLFDHCLFHNAGANSDSTVQTVAMNLGAASGASVLLWDSWLFGATDWADDFTCIETLGSMGQATGATAGLSIAAA